jgi:hypothetical protein
VHLDPRTATSDFKYRYLPLKPSRKEIRILVLDPPISLTGIRRTVISGNLVHVSLNDKPKFQAISYTWGEPTPVRHILLDGNVVQIRENLWTALDHILSDAHRASFRAVWADSICIDQSSIAEKNHQVPLMASIYSSADNVLAWLGPSTPSDLLAIERMTEIAATYPGDAIYQPENQPDWSAIAQTEGPAYRAFHSLLRKPYWWRVWTQQEMAFALRRRELFFCCGETGFFAFRLHAACLFYSVMEQRLRERDREALRLGGGELDQTDHKARNDVWSRMLLTCDPGRPVLMKSILAVGWLMATDPRDHVYGLLAMADDAEELGIVPDYGKEVTEVFVEFAMAYLKRGDLDLMGYCQVPKSLPGLPSWVPDWTGCITRRPGMEFDPAFRDNAWGDTKARVSFLSGASHRDSALDNTAGPPILCLEGVRLGEIKNVGRRWSDPDPPDTGDIVVAVLVLHELLTVMSHYEERHVSWRECPNTVFAVPIDGTYRLPRPGQDETDESPGASILPERIRVESLQHLQASCFALAELHERLSEMEVEARRTAIATDGSKRHGFLDDPELKELAERAMEYGSKAVNLSMVKRSRVFVTTGGHVGTGTYQLEEGDIVCIIHGAQAPYILRPAEGGMYTFVGTAYVQDCMRGSAMKSGVDGETFQIV